MADNLVRRPRRETGETWGSFTDWTKTLRSDPTLTSPIRVLWGDYLAHCCRWGFPAAGPVPFVRWLGELRGVTVSAPRGRGRIRRMVSGVAPGG